MSILPTLDCSLRGGDFMWSFFSWGLNDNFALVFPLVVISIELTGFFHQPDLWEQGYVNYTVSQGNETLFSVQVNHTLQEEYNAIWLNMTGNITIEIQSTGSDNPTDDKPGDYYVSNAEIHLLA